MLCLQAPFYECEGSRQPLGEPCFQPRYGSSTLAQFALRSVSWSGAAGLPPTIIDLACSLASPLSPSSLTGLCLDKVLEALLWCWELPVPLPAASSILGEITEHHLGKKVLLPPLPHIVPHPTPRPIHLRTAPGVSSKAISRLIYYAITFHDPSCTGMRNVNWWVSLRCYSLGFTVVSKGGEGKLCLSLWWLQVHSHWLLLMLKPMVMIDLNPVIYSILGH